MRRIVPGIFFFLVFLFAGSNGTALENLQGDPQVTQRITQGDFVFLSSFEIYHAGTKEFPVALLLDFRGDLYRIASSLWEDPIGVEEAIHAIRKMQERYQECPSCFFRPPQALAIINTKGEKVGYIYTGLRDIFMERRRDGKVKVFLPSEVPGRDKFLRSWPISISCK